MTAPLDRIDALFAHNARTVPDNVHLLDVGAGQQTFGETHGRAGRLAAALIALGVRPQDRVAVLAGNSRELIELYVGCGIAGAICVPLNILSAPAEVTRYAEDCAPSALVVAHHLLDRIEPRLSDRFGAARIVVGGTAEGWLGYEEVLVAHPVAAAPVSAAGTDPAIMIYSSGTTGRPKGILLSHAAVVQNAQMTQAVARYQMDDRNLVMLPLFSSFGFCWDFLMSALAASSLIIRPKFDPEDCLAAIARHRPTVLIGVPTMFARLFDPELIRGVDLSSIRLMDVGGGPVAERLKQDLKTIHGIEIIESYGLTEISPVAAAQIPYGTHKPGSTGPTLPGIEGKVLDADGNILPPNTPGELCFRSPTFMLGYWNQPEQTAQAIRDGWLHTGDVGTIDEDGHVFIRDRLKDMIVSNGYNVYPKEVENALCEHPAVQSAAVIGVPDEIRGETIHAFVVLKSGSTATSDEMLAHCAARVAKYKLPRGVTFLDALPLTASGKIQRFALRQQLAAAADGR
jgi:acyl-CoA synthetase (AMP-forming)/AMP-acid ligase II